MQKPPIPKNEADRLASLRSLNILDTAAEERFDRLTRLAKTIVGAPIALISLVDANRQWFKSKQGLEASETPRDISFCGHTILSRDIFYIPHASQDPRFADNPLVTGPPDIQSYAGVPLKMGAGVQVGTLCVIDDRPTHYSDEQLQALRDLADCVEAELNQQSLVDLSNALTMKHDELQLALSHIDKAYKFLESLHQITANTRLSFADKIAELLLLGRHFFELPLAIVSRIEGDSYEIQYADAVSDAPPSGTKFDLGDTYCVHTLNAETAIAFNHVARSEIHCHPCYQKFKLESYIGTPIQVNGKVFGTLNFSSELPRKIPFTSEDLALVTLIGQWIGNEISNAENIDALTNAKEQAEQLNRAKSEFLNIMSHELRTPLTVILGYLPLLQNPAKMPTAEQIASLTKDMDSAGHQLLALINDLLDISKIESNAISLKREQVNLSTLLRNVLGSLERLADINNDSFVVALQTEQVFADPVRLKQILYNLLSNAIKFTHNGTITISSSVVEDEVFITIEDTGCGIPASQLDKVFDKFHQVDSSSTRSTRGSGLGLSITKRLINLHGGEVNLSSELGKGTRFTFSIKHEGD